MTDRAGRGRLRRWWWLAGLAIAALVVIVLAPLASEDPDGLERVATDEGFLGLGQDAPFEILPDYTILGLDGSTSTIVAGLIGLVIVFGLMVLVGRALARRRDG
jgi:hypothetical protein